MQKIVYFIKRLLQGVLIVLFIAVINFFLIRAAPGDPVSVMAGEAGASDEVFIAQLKERFGLDKSLPEQLITYMGNVIRLDLGESYRQQKPVVELIIERLPATFLLTLSALAVSLIIGVSLGVVASRRRGSTLDSVISFISLLFYATPLFWLGLMLVLFFSVQLNWLPGFGYQTVGAKLTGFEHYLDIARHLLLPMFTLATFYIAVYARMTRTSMLNVSEMDYIKTAYAKGLPERRILTHHILKNALLPIITLVGVQAGALVGGTVLTETVFAWPGVGRLMFDALLQRDYSLLLGTFLFTSAMAVFFNIVTDIAYTIVDPRIQLK